MFCFQQFDCDGSKYGFLGGSFFTGIYPLTFHCRGNSEPCPLDLQASEPVHLAKF